MDKIIQLRLYGPVDHTGAEHRLAWQLFQTEALTRLRDISLSSTPARFAPYGMAASRFEHTVGVGYLARKLCGWRRPLAEHRDLLVAASLCHDIGSPPFSHISELFFWTLTGRTHEQQTGRLLAPGSEIADVLGAHEVDPAAVVEVITGRDPQLGPLIAGTIDLDNVDNSLHLLNSLGYQYEQPYHPLRLLRAFRFRGGAVELDSGLLSEILGWQEARRLLYDILHSDPNLSGSTMLYRALEYGFAADVIDERFFALGESEAMIYLRDQAGPEAGLLIDQALRWKHYPLLYSSLEQDEDPRLASLYDDWRARKEFSDRIAAELGIPAVELALYIGRDRGEKAITLPFIGEHADAVSELFRYRQGPQRLAIFAASRHQRLRDTKKLARVIETATADLSETDPDSRHVFF